MPPAVLRGQAVPGPRLVLLMRAIPDDEVLEPDFLAMPGRQPVEPLVAWRCLWTLGGKGDSSVSRNVASMHRFSAIREPSTIRLYSVSSSQA